MVEIYQTVAFKLVSFRFYFQGIVGVYHNISYKKLKSTKKKGIIENSKWNFKAIEIS